jgi:alkanesulfonate monooxygenase SsuD/methylene tetrahydromethanopterin reductase-like flavin-dependent oxidoreductase (luciferase family)
MTSSSAFSSVEHAKLDYTCATFLSGAVARSVFDGYRKAYLEAHGRPAPDKRLAYLGVVATAGDRKTAFERAEHMKAYFTTAARLDAQFRNPPGFNPVKANVKMMQAGASAMRPRLRNGTPLPSDATIEHYIDAGLMFVGTPDDVYQQIKQFYADVGGFGNLLMMGQAGTLSHADTVDNLTLFAKHVLPRLQELSVDAPDVRYEAFA